VKNGFLDVLKKAIVYFLKDHNVLINLQAEEAKEMNLKAMGIKSIKMIYKNQAMYQSEVNQLTAIFILLKR